MAYRLGVDLGTTYTAAALNLDGRVEMLSLGNRATQIASVLYVKVDGTTLIGEPAEHRGAADPTRLAREFKRRIGGVVPIIIGGSPYSPQALLAKVLGLGGRGRDAAAGRAARTRLRHLPGQLGPVQARDPGAGAQAGRAARSQHLHRTRGGGDRLRLPGPGARGRQARRVRPGRWHVRRGRTGPRRDRVPPDRESRRRRAPGWDRLRRGRPAARAEPPGTGGAAAGRLRSGHPAEPEPAASGLRDRQGGVVQRRRHGGPGRPARAVHVRADDPGAVRGDGAPGDRRDGVGHAAGAVLGRRVAGGAARHRHGRRFLADSAGRPGARDGLRPAAGPGQPSQARCGAGRGDPRAGARSPRRPEDRARRGWRRPSGRGTGVRDPGVRDPGSPTGKRSSGPTAAGGPAGGIDAGRCAADGSSTVRAEPRTGFPGCTGSVVVAGTGCAAGVGWLRSRCPTGAAGWPGAGAGWSGNDGGGTYPPRPDAYRPDPSRGGASGSPQRARGPRRLVAIGAIGAVVVLAVVLGIAVLPGVLDRASTGSATPTPPPTSGSTPVPGGLPTSVQPLADDVIVWPYFRNGSFDISTVTSDGRTGPPLAASPEEDGVPLVSPDRRTIFYLHVTAPGVRELRVMGADGSGDRPLFDPVPEGCGNVQRPAFGVVPEPQLVLPCVDPGTADVTLKLVKPDGRVVRDIDRGWLSDPALSPDGKFVVYWQDNATRGDGGAIYQTPTDGSGPPTQITPGGRVRDNDASVSPKGDLVAITRGGQGIWTVASTPARSTR